MPFFVEQIKKIRLSDYSEKTQEVIKLIKTNFGVEAINTLYGEGFFDILEDYKENVVGRGYSIGEYEVYSSYIACLKRSDNVSKTKLAEEIIKNYHSRRSFTFELINKLTALGYFTVEKHGNGNYVVITDIGMETLLRRENEKV